MEESLSHPFIEQMDKLLLNEGENAKIWEKRLGNDYSFPYDVPSYNYVKSCLGLPCDDEEETTNRWPSKIPKGDDTGCPDFDIASAAASSSAAKFDTRRMHVVLRRKGVWIRRVQKYELAKLKGPTGKAAAPCNVKKRSLDCLQPDDGEETISRHPSKIPKGGDSGCHDFDIASAAALLYPSSLMGKSFARHMHIVVKRRCGWMRRPKDFEPPEPKGKGKAAPCNVKKGERFDVMKFLVSDDIDEGEHLVRNDGSVASVESLKDKYVLLCCFHVPMYWGDVAIDTPRAISSFCQELASSDEGKQCEMVMVARMRPYWADDKSAFDHFFKAFPACCLTVPFDHKNRIDRICWSLGLSCSSPLFFFISPNGTVLLDNVSKSIWKHGVKDLSPFSPKNLDSVNVCYESLLRGPPVVSSSRPLLATLLGSEPDLRLMDLTGNNTKSISDLARNTVGLYLCCTGSLLDRLVDVTQQCKRKRLDFEIVVVWFPDIMGIEKTKFQQLMTNVFRSRGFSCWLFPFDNSVNRRLVRCTGEWTCPRMNDRLLSVGANGKFVDPCADIIIQLWDTDYAYPFSLESIVDREVEKLKQVTLQSILEQIPSAVRVKGKDQSLLDANSLRDELIKKKVVLYHGCVESCSNSEDDDEDEREWYFLIKDDHPDCELLYVQSRDVTYGDDKLPEVPLYMCPFNSNVTESLYTITTVNLGSQCVPATSLGFVNGHITSFNSVLSEADPFANTLRKDIRSKLVSQINGHEEMCYRPSLHCMV